MTKKRSIPICEGREGDYTFVRISNDQIFAEIQATREELRCFKTAIQKCLDAQNVKISRTQGAIAIIGSISILTLTFFIGHISK